MKFTLSWLKDHLDTDAAVDQVAAAMTMAGLEVEHVEDPSAKLAAFSVARIVEAVQHPNADRLRVCQVDTRDGRLEIVCGAPNARVGLTTIYAPLGATIPGSGVTLEAKPVRGVVSHGMLCSARELEVSEESDGILELPNDLAVGTPAAEVFGADPVIDFEVTPNRPDWLGVAGIARDLAATGLGRLKTPPVKAVPGAFPCPIDVRLAVPEACPMFAGRVVRGVRNGPSPEWLQAKLRAVGQRPISALVDITNYLSLDRCRPLHVYDVGKLSGQAMVVRLGHGHEHLIALNGQTYALGPDMCVIADGVGEGEPDGARPIDLGGVMGGASTGVSVETTEVFIEAAWFDPIRTAETGRALSLFSDAQYRFARGVDPGFVLPGLELATRLVLELCGGEASEVVVAGAPPAPLPPIDFDPAYVGRLAGLDVGSTKTRAILESLGFETSETDGGRWRVQPPTWRRDVDGPADLVEEVARIVGFDAVPSTPLPHVEPSASGVLTPRQARARIARRAMAAMGYAEAIGWSFTARATATLFGGGTEALTLVNPIASELDCMRPSALPGLIEAAGRNARRGFPDCALFEVGPVFAGDRPQDQRTVVAAVLAPHAPRRWDGAAGESVFTVKGDLLALLEEIGAPVGSLQTVQGQAGGWWHPGRSARLQLGPRAVLAEFGELHPSMLSALDTPGPVYGFELWLEAVPEPKRRALKTRSGLSLSPLMPLSRDLAFVVDRARAAGDLVRAAERVDKTLIETARVFDIYEGAGVPEGKKSVALELHIQPRERTLTDAEIEALTARVVGAVSKTTGAVLRG